MAGFSLFDGSLSDGIDCKPSLIALAIPRNRVLANFEVCNVWAASHVEICSSITCPLICFNKVSCHIDDIFTGTLSNERFPITSVPIVRSSYPEIPSQPVDFMVNSCIFPAVTRKIRSHICPTTSNAATLRYKDLKDRLFSACAT